MDEKKIAPFYADDHEQLDGYFQRFQGKGGGIELAVWPEKINLGKIVEQTESDFDLVECFNDDKNACRISPSCKLKGYLVEAQRAFLSSLSEHTLADIIKNKTALKDLINS